MVNLLILSSALAAYRGYKPAYFLTMAFTSTYITAVVVATQGLDMIGYSDKALLAHLIGATIEGPLFSFGLAYRIKRMQQKQAEDQRKRDHYFDQLTKVFYPHQLEMMKNGQHLESTVPTIPADACVISFDIIGSSKIKHEKTQEFFRSVFRRCNELMMEGYDKADLAATAYRIKEMGDGFLCSIGYPFKSKSGHMAQDALELSLSFYKVFQEEVEKLDYRHPICCGIGIALDHISGFYPESGAKEYDLYGRAIVLATRYEGMRKVLMNDNEPASMIILHERVYLSLRSAQVKQFLEFELAKNGLVVRDDPSATKLYYAKLHTLSEQQADSQNALRAVI